MSKNNCQREFEINQFKEWLNTYPVKDSDFTDSADVITGLVRAFKAGIKTSYEAAKKEDYNHLVNELSKVTGEENAKI